MDGIKVATPELRNWYLSTLGIVQYIPRGSQMQTPDAREVAEGSAQPASSEPVKPRKKPPRILLDDDGAREGRGAATPAGGEQKRVSPSLVPEGTEEVPEALAFRLASWAVSPDLLVLDSLAPGRRPGKEHVAVLARMLRAVHRGTDTLSGFELLDWPPTATTPAHREGAREMLGAFLDARRQVQGFSWVLLMGEMATICIADAGDYDAMLGNRFPLSCGAQGIVTRSLSEMIENPATKADTWRGIRFLSEQK